MNATPEAIRNLLLPGETVVWSGRPPQGLRLFWRDVILVPFSLTWGGGAILWETEVAMMHGMPVPALWIGGFFSVYGLFMILVRHLVDAYVRGRIHYAITDRRVLIVRGGVWPSQRVYPFDRCPEPRLWWSGRNRGTILFGEVMASGGIVVPERPTLWALLTMWVPGLYPFPQFFAIRDPERVFSTLQNAVAGRPVRPMRRDRPMTSGLVQEQAAASPEPFGRRPTP